MCARMGKAPWTSARDQCMVAGAMGPSSCSRGVVRIRCSHGLRVLIPFLAEGDDGGRLMDWADSTVRVLETWRGEDGFRDAVMGVPSAVGVGVENNDPDSGAGAAGLGSLKVEVDTVAWCSGWRYGERDWTARVCEER